MSTFVEKIFRTDSGVDSYNPDLITDQLTFFYLTNVEPRLGRLKSSNGLSQFFDLTAALAANDQLISFAYYQLSTRSYCNLYVFSRTSIYWFDFSIGQFAIVPIYTGFLDSADIYVTLPWYDALYVTKPRCSYVKVVRKEITVISGAPSAKYGIIANSHAYLAGINDGITSQLARVRWSDLDDPESFALNPQSSEADLFDLEPDSMEITGLSYQRSSTRVYAINTIWQGTPIGFPGGFRHEPVFPGIGNIFHYAVVRNQSVDYFIAADNIYSLNGFQLVPIGDRIFERFINDVDTTPSGGDSTVNIRGYLDSRRYQVYWTYKSISKQSLWSIVYNYKEDKWSERDPQDIRGWLDAPRTALRGYDAIDDIGTIIDDDHDLIDNPLAGYPVVIPQLAGIGSKVAQTGSTFLKLDGSSFANLVETTDFFFDSVVEVKEINKVSLAFVGSGAPNLTIQVGVRSSQSDVITWSAALGVVTENDGVSFFVRAQGVGKYIRFRFSWNNTDNSYVDDIRVIQLTKVDDSDVNQEK